MDIDALLVLAGLGVGFLVGLTGMGGGALLTPLLVLGFGIPPLVAVGSDLVASLTMKPVGAAVHLRRGTVDLRLVWWLAAGSVPSAFSSLVIGSLPGVYVGARLSSSVSTTLIRRVLVFVLFGTGLTLLNTPPAVMAALLALLALVALPAWVRMRAVVRAWRAAPSPPDPASGEVGAGTEQGRPSPGLGEHR